MLSPTLTCIERRHKKRIYAYTATDVFKKLMEHDRLHPEPSPGRYMPMPTGLMTMHVPAPPQPSSEDPGENP